jgi:hypothetical protein
MRSRTEKMKRGTGPFDEKEGERKVGRRIGKLGVLMERERRGREMVVMLR